MKFDDDREDEAQRELQKQQREERERRGVEWIQRTE